MASPLSLYVLIKTDPITQGLAEKLRDGLVDAVGKGLNASQIVHYARVVLIPYPEHLRKPDDPNKPKWLGLMLVTTFDESMTDYLGWFWEHKSTRAAFQGLAMMALNTPGPVDDLPAFEKFITRNNLSDDSDQLYQAYDQTVKQIKAAFPPAS